MQAKRIQVGEGNNGAGGRTAAVLTVPADPREEVNFHNIWGSVTVEPQDADANCQGTWVLLLIRDPATAIPVFTDAFMNLETINFDIIACGVFSASNQSPYNSGPIHPLSSRNLPAGGRLVLASTITGITAGTASNRMMLCAHTTRK